MSEETQSSENTTSNNTSTEPTPKGGVGGGWKIFGLGSTGLGLILSVFLILLANAVLASRQGAVAGYAGGIGGSCPASPNDRGIPQGAQTALHDKIPTTQFGGGNDPGDSGNAGGPSTGANPATQWYAALPTGRLKTLCGGTSGDPNNCARITVTNPKSSKSVVLAVVDSGPCNTKDDDYVFNGARPQVEQQPNNSTYVGGCSGQSPKAALDVSPWAMKELGGDDFYLMNWQFTNNGLGPCTQAVTIGGGSNGSVVIDAGHYSDYNQFSRSVAGANNEGDSNWNIAIKVKQKLEASGINVSLTKGSATADLPLSARVDFANSLNASLFVSLHSNDSGGSGAMGLIRCEHSGVAGDRSPVDYVDFSKCESSSLIEQSKNLAKTITDNIQNNFRFSASPRYLGGHLGVLKHANMPATIIEMFAHDQESDLTKVDGQDDRMAEVIASSIVSYLRK